MSETETRNETPFTATELAYRDQLVLAAMQGDWASQGGDMGIFTPYYSPPEIRNRAKAYFLFAEAVLLERRKRSLTEDQILKPPTPHTHTKEDVVKGGSDWDKIPGGGSVVQPLTGYGIADGQPAARDPRLFSKEQLAGIPPEMVAATDATCDKLLREMGITPKSDTAVNPKDPRLQDGRHLDRRLTIDDFPPGTFIRFQGDDPRIWQTVAYATPHRVKLAGGTTLALSSEVVGMAPKRNEVILSHDGGKTWS